MKWSLLSLMVVVLIGCQSRQARTELAVLRPLTGTYYRGDGLGYNVSLDLRPDGSYDAKWRGCLGVYGTARGQWSLDGEHIVLSPKEETDMMTGHLRRLDVARHEGSVILLPSDDREFYDMHGASRYSCFHRTETLK